MRLGNLKLGKTPRICGVVAESLESPTLRRAVASGADMLEIRVDTLRDNSSQTLLHRLERLSKKGLPLLLTVRSVKEGGQSEMGDAERLALIKELTPLVDAVDIELSSRGIIKEVIKTAAVHKKKVIVSYHNFKATPGSKRLAELVEKARAAGADAVKIAATARNAGELKRLTGLLLGERNLIVIAMGRSGRASRVFFPLLGSLVTYGSVTASTAPGQMTVAEMKREFTLLGF